MREVSYEAQERKDGPDALHRERRVREDEIKHQARSPIISRELTGLFIAISPITVTLNTLLLKGIQPLVRRESKPKQGSGDAQRRQSTVSAGVD